MEMKSLGHTKKKAFSNFSEKGNATKVQSSGIREIQISSKVWY